MTIEERARTLNHADIVDVLLRNDELERQLAWFKKQMFGERSERRSAEPDPRQLALGEQFAESEQPAEAAPKKSVKGYDRSAKPRQFSDEDEPREWFDGSVPIKTIQVPDPRLDGLVLDKDYEVVSTKVTHRLAQRRSAYEVLRYERRVVKFNGELSAPPAPASVFDKSIADVSVLTGIIIDKCLYFNPLYRQHQRMKAAGVNLSRSALTNWVHRTGDLIMPIHRAQIASILSSSHLTIDETANKAGHIKPGKLKRGWFWALYGGEQEIGFIHTESRSLKELQKLLGANERVLQSDGLDLYQRYAARVKEVVHAECWSHTRRQFLKAEKIEPELTDEVVKRIRKFYEIEEKIRERDLTGAKKLEYRAEHSRPLVDDFFTWLQSTQQQHLLLPSSPFTKALNYALTRENELKVFLTDPDVAIDTNHNEREIRTPVMARRNYLFCWTEIGAEYLAAFHSLIGSCRLQGIDPRTYLIDVLQRVQTHPASDIGMLIPRLWKEHFADAPLKSDIDISTDQVESLLP
jgi:transposase